MHTSRTATETSVRFYRSLRAVKVLLASAALHLYRLPELFIANGVGAVKSSGFGCEQLARALVNDFVSGSRWLRRSKRLGVNTVLLHPSSRGLSQEHRFAPQALCNTSERTPSREGLVLGRFNQLQHALGYYYLTALKAFDDWALPSAWAFVEAFPTPEALLKAGRRKWERWLHANKLFHSRSNERRLELFARAGEFRVSSATTLAKSLLAVSRVKMLRLIERQLAVYRKRIEVLFAQHPDHELFTSLPGAVRSWRRGC